MHVSKAHTTTGSLQERAQDGFGYKFGYILLAALANGAAWSLIALIVCLIGGFGSSTVPLAAGLITGGATFVGLFAFAKR